MQIGPVYRFRVADISADRTQEVFPTVEVIDRLYPPPGLALRYPIPIELTADELQMAADGMFVTRVIYVENPNQALPVATVPDEQPWVEAPQGADPLAVADEMGRPVAILRMGGRVPSPSSAGTARLCAAARAVQRGMTDMLRDIADCRLQIADCRFAFSSINNQQSATQQSFALPALPLVALLAGGAGAC